MASVDAMAERVLHFVGPWDLNASLACVPSEPGAHPVVLVESLARGAALPWHRQKLVLVLSAMRHFAAELRAAGHEVLEVRADDYLAGIAEAARCTGATRARALRPRDHGIDQRFTRSARDGGPGVPLELLDDGGPGGHFLLTRAEFAAWAAGRRTLRLEHFYAMMRRRSGLLMTGDAPLGGRWSFDAANREHARGARPPDVVPPVVDAVTRATIERVERWPQAWGRTEGFAWPVTRTEALAGLDAFIRERGAGFGRYEDAMLHGQSTLWHSRLSVPLNLGLLHPREVLDRVVEAHADGRMPLAAAEGFVRQVLGWREFMRGMYLLRMPAMRAANHLGASRPLPEFYWDPPRTDMRCMRDTVQRVHDTGYAHHIERLMVLGNFALLAGVEPLALSHWFWAAFVDAYEWVELPNVHGMALFADPAFTSKPYAASGAYIDRMSDHCGSCRYRVKARTGRDSCPFNSLFWQFLDRHRDHFARHPRLGALYRTWDRWPEAERAAIRATAAAHLERMEPSVNDWHFADDAG
jgi:deoxyribodipyrimidine photolyase-related protein